MTAEKKTDQPVETVERATPLEPGEPQVVPAVIGATFAERKANREKQAKAVQGGENKAVKAAEKK